MNDSTAYPQLVTKLKEIFQINSPELDFGIYRILNSRATEIKEFLEQSLPKKIQTVLKDNPEQENLVYNHLYTFFSRYYDNGDFISQRRYKNGTYAIPYEGEEVVLYWANKDQYYTKSGEYFSNYAFILDNGKKVTFRLIEADTAKDNRKDNDSNRLFVLTEQKVKTTIDENGDEIQTEILPIEEKENELVLHFEYKSLPKKTKQPECISQAIERVGKHQFNQPENWKQLFARVPTESDKDRNVLKKHLQNYTAKNSADYFIHKNLGRFLNQELDFYIKSEVMNLDNIQAETQFDEIEYSLTLIKIFKTVAQEIIAFLAQLENFQKKLWLKKKFVVDCHYLITLDKILGTAKSDDLVAEVFANSEQLAQWESLYNVNASGQDSKEIFKQYPHLVVDTSLFPSAFQAKVLAEIEDLDENTDGVLIHSDNFQALNLLQERYREQVKCIYIDPPYNTEDDRSKGKFIYKDGYPSSTWASLISSRLQLAKLLLNPTGILFQSIDDNEHSRLKIITDEVFGIKNHLTSFIRKTKSMTGDDSNGLNIQHEYLIAHSMNKNNLKIFGEEKTLDDYSNPDNDPNGDWKPSDPSAKSGGPSTYFPIKNPYTGIEDYPPDGRYWAFSKETMKQYIDSGRIKFKKTYNSNCRGFIFKRYANSLTSKFMPVGTLFASNNEYMNSVATIEIKDFLTNSDGFNYPKPEIFIEKLAKYTTFNHELILDYFAGSGTTAHAVINLNRKDGGKRKYILVEQGEYFNTVLKPRIQKVLFSENWKDGEPISENLNGLSQIVKVLKLESYEDTLNNLVLNKFQDSLFSEKVKQDYLLRYMLDVESRESLLNTSHFYHPFDYELNIATDSAGAYSPQKMDLVETFNYLLGVRVKRVDSQVEKGVVLTEGEMPNGEKTLIIWRDCEKLDYEKLNDYLKSMKINSKENEFELIYINGDHSIPSVFNDENDGVRTLKIRQIETEFLSRMFKVE